MGFQPYLQLPSSKKQIRLAMLRFHLVTMVLFYSFQLLQKKLFDKSPICYYVLRNSVIFDPLIMSQENVGVLQSKLKKLLTHLTNIKLFQPQFCDKVTQEFLEFVGHEMKLHSHVFQSFKRDNTSLDVLFFSYTDIVKYKELSTLVKVILTLTHGQAAVERGFSIKNSLSKVNITEQSLLCKKIVRDHLISNHTVPITNQLMRSVALAHQKYNERSENKKNDREKENCSNEKKKITEEIAVVTQKYEQFQKLNNSKNCMKH